MRPQSSSRLSAQERREAILDAAMPLFAQRGLHGVSTKDLAKGAGVSEALLFKHFASKDALYEALRTRCCLVSRSVQAVTAAPPSTATLVHSVYFLVRGVALGSGANPARHEMLTRLVVMSMIEDGTFAREFIAGHIGAHLPFLTASWQAARIAGDIHADAPSPQDGLWFTHHMALMLALSLRHDHHVVEFASNNRDALIIRMTTFALQGLGMTRKALNRYVEGGKLAQNFATAIANAGADY